MFLIIDRLVGPMTQRPKAYSPTLGESPELDILEGTELTSIESSLARTSINRQTSPSRAPGREEFHLNH